MWLDFWILDLPIEVFISCLQNGCRNHSMKPVFDVSKASKLRDLEPSKTQDCLSFSGQYPVDPISTNTCMPCRSVNGLLWLLRHHNGSAVTTPLGGHESSLVLSLSHELWLDIKIY
jgi:hypothetical protein